MKEFVQNSIPPKRVDAKNAKNIMNFLQERYEIAVITVNNDLNVLYTFIATVRTKNKNRSRKTIVKGSIISKDIAERRYRYNI